MDSQWLKIQFDLNPDKTKADLAKALGLEPPAVSKILNGTRQIKATEYIAMRAFFGLPSDGLSALRTQDHSYTLRPLGHSGLDDDPKMLQSNSDWVIPAAVLSPHTRATPDKIKIFPVRESIMEPDFRQGSYVLVDLSNTKPSPPGAFVISDGFGHMIRLCEFVAGSRPPEIKISAHDKNFLEQTLREEDFTVIGRVIAKLQMV